MKKNKTYKELEALLSNLQETKLENMLSDLNDPDKRSPQLYNSIIKELERNGIDCVPKAGESDENALQQLLEATTASLEGYGGMSLHGEA